MILSELVHHHLTQNLYKDQIITIHNDWGIEAITIHNDRAQTGIWQYRIEIHPTQIEIRINHDYSLNWVNAPLRTTMVTILYADPKFIEKLNQLLRIIPKQ